MRRMRSRNSGGTPGLLPLGLYFNRAYGTRNSASHAFPPLKRWAIIGRPYGTAVATTFGVGTRAAARTCSPSDKALLTAAILLLNFRCAGPAHRATPGARCVAQEMTLAQTRVGRRCGALSPRRQQRTIAALRAAL